MPELHDLTYDQRVECETLLSGSMAEAGDTMNVINWERYYQYRTKTCMYGLGLDNTESLRVYSSSDLSEIANEVLVRATAGTNPTA